jgi:hypothetical protein
VQIIPLKARETLQWRCIPDTEDAAIRETQTTVEEDD